MKFKAHRLFGARVPHVLCCDKSGRFDGLFAKTAKGTWQKIENPIPGKCVLAVPPGMSAVRSLVLGPVSKKQALQAIDMEARATLFHEKDQGFVFESVNTGPDRTTVFMIWLAREYLFACRKTAMAKGYDVSGLLVPEQLLGKRRAALFCFEGKQSSGVWFLSEQIPICQSGSSTARESLLSTVMAQADQIGLSGHDDTFIWAMDQDKARAWIQALKEMKILNPPMIIRTWADLLPHMDLTTLVGRTKPFGEFIHLSDRQPLAPVGYLKLAGFVCVSLLAVGLFLSIHFSQAQNELGRLRKTAAGITRASKKSTQATYLIRETQEKAFLLRKFAEEKPYRLALVRDIIDAGSGKSRLENISVTQDGSISIQGSARDEIYITSIVKKLEESSLIMHCQLNSMESDPENKVLKFSIQARAEKWKDFFNKRTDN